MNAKVERGKSKGTFGKVESWTFLGKLQPTLCTSEQRLIHQKMAKNKYVELLYLNILKHFLALENVLHLGMFTFNRNSEKPI